MITLTDYSKTFYVYELSFPEGSPFYVGKGTDDGSRKFHRAHQSGKRGPLVSALLKAMRARGEKPEVNIVYETTNEAEAFAEEVRLIAKYGRRFDGGLLWNVADGGLGGTCRGRPLSPEWKERIGASNRGRKRTTESRQRMSLAQVGKKRSQSHIARVSEGLRGRVVSAETRAKISAAQSGMPRKKHSPETRQRMAESARRAWDARRRA